MHVQRTPPMPIHLPVIGAASARNHIADHHAPRFCSPATSPNIITLSYLSPIFQ
jgi:hypothetical protein